MDFFKDMRFDIRQQFCESLKRASIFTFDESNQFFVKMDSPDDSDEVRNMIESNSDVVDIQPDDINANLRALYCVYNNSVVYIVKSSYYVEDYILFGKDKKSKKLIQQGIVFEILEMKPTENINAITTFENAFKEYKSIGK